MIFENKLTTAKLKMVYVIILGAVASLSAFFFFERYDFWVKDLIVGIIAFLVSVYIFLLMLKPDFIYINDTKEKIIVRYYSSHPFFRKYKTFEIPIRAVDKFKINKSFGGLKRDIVFTAKNKGKIIMFPSVSITGLNKKERKVFEKFLIRLDNELKMYKQ